MPIVIPTALSKTVSNANHPASSIIVPTIVFSNVKMVNSWCNNPTRIIVSTVLPTASLVHMI